VGCIAVPVGKLFLVSWRMVVPSSLGSSCASYWTAWAWRRRYCDPWKCRASLAWLHYHIPKKCFLHLHCCDNPKIHSMSGLVIMYIKQP
jgi:hypothetical protein